MCSKRYWMSKQIKPFSTQYQTALLHLSNFVITCSWPEQWYSYIGVLLFVWPEQWYSILACFYLSDLSSGTIYWRASICLTWAVVLYIGVLLSVWPEQWYSILACFYLSDTSSGTLYWRASICLTWAVVLIGSRFL